MTALQDLLAKVEAGIEPTTADFCVVFPSRDDDDDYHDWAKAEMAFKGWLDAFTALGESVLPGWIWGCGHSGENDPFVFSAGVAQTKHSRMFEGQSNASPANAGLIAILRALIAQEGEA